MIALCAECRLKSSLLAVIIRIQMLSELEEIIRYKQLSEQPDKQATMRKTWMKR